MNRPKRWECVDTGKKYVSMNRWMLKHAFKYPKATWRRIKTKTERLAPWDKK